MNRTSSNPTPWAIICPKDGQIFLTELEYNRQMNKPNSRWQCPKCGEMPVDWDDDNYEKYLDDEGKIYDGNV